MWFTITTMTTVGYGDYVPRSAPGRAIASIACVLGIVLLALVAQRRHQRFAPVG